VTLEEKKMWDLYVVSVYRFGTSSVRVVAVDV